VRHTNIYDDPGVLDHLLELCLGRARQRRDIVLPADVGRHSAGVWDWVGVGLAAALVRTRCRGTRGTQRQLQMAQNRKQRFGRNTPGRIRIKRQPLRGTNAISTRRYSAARSWKRCHARARNGADQLKGEQ
jgi:hypothetical protein